jgi:hypothetical protein
LAFGRLNTLAVLLLILLDLGPGLLDRNVLGFCESVRGPIARILRLLLIAGNGGPHGGNGRVTHRCRVVAACNPSKRLLDR